MNIIDYTQGGITQPADKLGNSSGAPERAKWENQERMLFSQYLFLNVSRINCLVYYMYLINDAGQVNAAFLIGPYKEQIASSINLVF